MKPILEIKGISKKYTVRHEKRQSYSSLRDSITEFFQGKRGYSSEEFWVLKDISFDINPGESIGIIGKNGAGKSTLLKIFSKIIPPTQGRIISRGRIASLLEVGTGFHPELTGRENIFLNGAILGMKQKEILKNFDEIVDFSGVERFLDTPLKRYSSGMQLRLAFSVAAFLEPEILIIDEVLAVGDAEFQKKCIGKMDDVSKSGRTVIFVSHNMAAVSQLCQRALYLSDGKLKLDSDVPSVMKEYLNDDLTDSPSVRFSSQSTQFHFDTVEILDASGNLTNNFSMGDDMYIRIRYTNNVLFKKIQLCIIIKNIDGQPISYIIDSDSRFSVNDIRQNQVELVVGIKDIRLYPNTYLVSLVADELGSHPLDTRGECITFKIDNGGGLTQRSLPKHTGVYFLTPEWKVN